MAVDSTPQLLQRSLRWLTRATVVLYVVLITAIAYTYHDLAQKQDSLASTRAGVCAFRADLESRVKASEQYLADHPGGVFGLSPAQLRSSLDGQRRTVAALQAVTCPD